MGRKTPHFLVNHPVSRTIFVSHHARSTKAKMGTITHHSNNSMIEKSMQFDLRRCLGDTPKWELPKSDLMSRFNNIEWPNRKNSYNSARRAHVDLVLQDAKNNQLPLSPPCRQTVTSSQRHLSQGKQSYSC